MATAEMHTGVKDANPWIAAALSAAIPGLGHVYTRRYRSALAWFLPVVVIIIYAILAFDFSLADIIDAALSTSVLWGIFWLNLAGALWRVGAAIDAFRGASPAGAFRSATLAVAVGWSMLTLVVIVPHAVVGRYTFDAISLVTNVFSDASESRGDQPVIPIGTDADIVPDPASIEIDPTTRTEPGTPGNEPAPWVIPERDEESLRGTSDVPPLNQRIGSDRITVLIAGGDSGPGRGGLRTDTMMVASIHLVTGKAALFSFPRNMGSIPLPSRFENAFIGYEQQIAPEPEPVEDGEEPPEFESCHCFPEQMNAIYPFTRKWTKTYPDELDPGMAALRDIIEGLMGVEIDYYALVDMAAFVDLVDAIGGIDVNVRQPLQAEVSPPREGDPWATVDVDVGWNHLSGSEALAYARARKGSSDYARMERQRCMLRAVAAKTDPFTLIKHFPAIADAVEGSVVTDIPRSYVSSIVSAAAGLSYSDIQTVGFTHNYWEPERDHLFHPIPDVDKIRWKVKNVFAGQDSGEVVEAGDSECEV